jgi:feruloyl esterase
VKPSNAEHIVRQWTDVHGLSATPSFEKSIGAHTRRVWSDANGEALVEAFSINGMAHGVPLASTLGADNCGTPGPFFIDAGISSTHHIAGFWHLGEGLAETSHAPATVPEPQPQPVQTTGRPVTVEAQAATSGSDEGSYAADAEQAARRPLDPMQVIGAALKAAGLPVSALPNKSFPNMPAGATPRVLPLPFIQAALKAAGLTRN